MTFLLPFHLAGGAALGVALRNIIQERFNLSSIPRNGFLLVWGIMFGGLLAGLIFGGVGGLLTVGGVWMLLRGR
jgi:ABC-type iron transport system FetAB permease component